MSFYDESPMNSDAIMANEPADRRLDLMRKWASLTDEICHEKKSMFERAEVLSKMEKEAERLRLDLLGIIAPETLPKDKPSRGEFQ